MSNLLITGIKNNDINLIRTFILDGGDINFRDGQGGAAPLFVAIGKKNINMLSLLLLNGIETNITTANKMSPLMLAISVRFNEGAKLLIFNDVDLNQTDQLGRSALLHAVSYSNLEIFQVLVYNSADTSVCDNKKNSALHYLAFSNLDDKGKLKIYEGTSLTQEQRQLKIYEYYWAMVEILLDKKINIDGREENNLTPLGIAIIRNNQDLVRILLEKGADINAQMQDGKTPLMLASENNYEDIFSQLLQAGANPEITNSNGKNLRNVTTNNQNKNIQDILDKKVIKGTTEKVSDILKVFGGEGEYSENADDNYSQVVSGSVDAVNQEQVIHGSGSDEDNVVQVVHGSDNGNGNKEENITQLVHGINDNQNDLVQVVKGNGDTESRDNFIKTVKGHFEDLVDSVEDILIISDSEENSNDDFFDPFRKIKSTSTNKDEDSGGVINTKNFFGDVLSSIEKNFQNENEQNEQNDEDAHDPFARKSTDGSIQKEEKQSVDIDQQIRISSNKDEDDSEILHLKYLPIKQKIKKVNIDQRFPSGLTLLMLAASVGSMDDVEILIANKANTDTRDYNGKTSLMYACIKNRKNIVEYLLSQKAKVDTKDENGYTALAYAVIGNCVEICKMLIRKGADMRLRIKGTPLISMAAGRGHKEIIALFLNCGVEVDSKDYRGKNAADYAFAGGHKALGDFLKTSVKQTAPRRVNIFGGSRK
ncbi:MAG: ankyrin repeat domain-containing protein [Oligoflexia bacterium]|nr:ankyrin repeat domain-containing protein [Oligoflexia bacterium]